MASIIQIGSKWRAQVRRKTKGKIVVDKVRSFDKYEDARKWATAIEAELDRQAVVTVAEDLRVAGLIRDFLGIRDDHGLPINPASNTHYMLRHLDEDLGLERVVDLTPARLAKWAAERQKQGAGGYTVNMELSQLGTVIRHVASFRQVNLPDVVGQARPMLRYMQLISGGNKRTRKPNDDEFDRLVSSIEAEDDPRVADAVRVSAITGLRRGELTRIAWAEVDEKAKAVLVRLRKHPRRKERKDEWVPLLGQSWDIVQRQPRVDARIFPMSNEKLTDTVTRACRRLGIPDLHLHDMRRKATSDLLDLGFARESRKKIVGHKADDVHDRYVAIDLDALHQQYDAATRSKQQRRSRPPATGAPPGGRKRTPPSPDGS